MAINIPIITEFVDSGLKSAQGAFDTFKAKVGEAEGGLGKLKAGANVAFDSIKANAGKLALVGGAAFAALGAKAISAASDFEESSAKIGEVFGDASGSVFNFAENAAQALGQSKQDVLTAAGTFGTFGKSAGLAGQDLATFSNDFTTLASDLASFNNTSPEEAIMALGAGLRGEAEPLRRYGILLDDATLRQEALRLGLIDTTKQALTPQQKVLAAQAAIYKQSSDAQGDFARTSDGLANQQRILQAELENVSIEIGEQLLPIAVEFAHFANDTLVPALKGVLDILIPVLEVLGKFSGTLDEGLAEAIEKAQEAGHSLSDIARELGANDERSLNYMAQVLGMTLDELYKELDDDLVPATYRHAEAIKEATRSMIEAKEASEDTAEAVLTVDDALAELTGNIDERRTFRKLQDSIEDAKDAAIKAFTEATPEAIRNSEAAIDDLRLDVAEYIYDIEDVPVEWQTKFIAALDQASIDEVERILAEVARARDVPFMPRPAPGVGGISEIGSGGFPIGEAPIGFGIPGQSGIMPITPELPSYLTNISTGRIPAIGAYSADVTVNVAGSVISENDLVETVRKGLVNSQRNGAGLVYSNR